MSESPFTPIDEKPKPPAAGEEGWELRTPNQSTVYLLCIMGAIDCLLAQARVSDKEFHAAIELKFKNAGYAYPKREEA